jgi:hypothetical protein
MKYQPLNDLIDPDVPAFDAPAPEPVADPDALEDAYVIGEHGNTVVTLGAEPSAKKERGPRKWVRPAAIALTVFCAGLTIWNVSRALQGPPPPPPLTQFQVKQTLYLGVMKIEAYRREHGVSPANGQDAGLISPPYAYARVDTNGYTLSVDLHGSRMQYSSAVPVERVFGTASEMLKMGDTQ